MAGAEESRKWGSGRPAWWCALGAVMLLGLGLRVAHYHEGYGHPDEAITVEVVGHMRSSGDWDTNWAKAPNLEAGLRYDQYNFSSHLFATFGFYRLVKVLPGTAGWRAEREGFWVYRFFSVLLATAVVWQTMRLAERVGGRAVALGAGVLVAGAVLLVQDAHFSRPEAFVTALTLAAVALSWPRERGAPAAILGAAGVLGVLVACKISMLALAWLPLVPWWAAWRAGRVRGWLLAALPVAGLVGFAAGAPGALAHPQVWWHGLQHLMVQYAGLHPPHSHMDGGPVADMMAAYFGATLGWPLLLAAGGGVVVLAVRRRWAELGLLAGPVVLFAGYFATRSVFFERNLSHVVPLLLILAAVGAVAAARWFATRVRVAESVAVAVLVGALVLPSVRLTWRLVQVEFSGEGPRRRGEAEEALRARHPVGKWHDVSLLNDGPLGELTQHFQAGKGPVLLRVTDYNDEWTAFSLRLLDARFEAKTIADASGSFPGLPTCTLLTYHSPRLRYFLVTAARPGA